MSSLAYYQPEHPGTAGLVKYPENGHDTLSDFVTFVCQEAENTQQLPQVTFVLSKFCSMKEIKELSSMRLEYFLR